MKITRDTIMEIIHSRIINQSVVVEIKGSI